MEILIKINNIFRSFDLYAGCERNLTLSENKPSISTSISNLEGNNCCQATKTACNSSLGTPAMEDSRMIHGRKQGGLLGFLRRRILMAKTGRSWICILAKRKAWMHEWLSGLKPDGLCIHCI